MRPLYNYIIILLLILIGILTGSCNRKELLDEKTNSSLVIPTTLQDFQALLDNYNVMNATPSIGEVSADNYYLLPADYNSGAITNGERNAYLWKKDLFFPDETVYSWDIPYKQVFVCNVVLDGLAKLTPTAASQQEFDAVKGVALFLRSYAFFNIAQHFAPFYDSATAASDAGIPLRLKPDISEVSVRASVKATYDRILEDLQASRLLLPPTVPPLLRNRPSIPAADALLARIYLSVRAYEQAGAAADESLKAYRELVDYNTLSVSSTLPFVRTNPEVLFQSMQETNSRILYGLIGLGNIDSTLYRSYAANDLRKDIFFRLVNNLPRLKGGYTGLTFLFSGLAADETYLIRAECRARAGQYQQAMDDLNTVLAKRFSGVYTPLAASDAAEALRVILTERRKELVVRGTRWSDLRRLNKENYNISPRRVLGEVNVSLPANSTLYTLPIPANVISYTGMPQNVR